MSDWHPSIPDPDECRSRLDRLEARQRQVLQLCVYGYTTKEIGRRLGITQKTVHNHLCGVYERLEVRQIGAALALVARAAGPDGVVQLFPQPPPQPAPMTARERRVLALAEKIAAEYAHVARALGELAS